MPWGMTSASGIPTGATYPTSGGFWSGMGPLALGGAALAGLGSYFGAQSSNRNARRWQDEQAREQSIMRNRAGGAYFGSAPWQALMTAGVEDFNNPGGSAAGRSAWDTWNSATGGPLYGQYNQLAADAAQGGADVSRGYYADTGRLRGLANDSIGRVQSAYTGGGRSLLTDFDAGSRDLTARVDEYGRGQEARIRRDAGRDLRDVNDQTRTALAAAGLGKSTAIGNQLAANSRRVNERRDDSLMDLGDAQIDRQVGLRRGLLSERTGYSADTYRRGAESLERGLAALMAQEQGRSTGQTQLDESALTRNVGMRAANLGNLQGQLAGMLQPTQTPYIPQYSLAGTALQAGGQGLGSLASLLALQQIYGGG